MLATLKSEPTAACNVKRAYTFFVSMMRVVQFFSQPRMHSWISFSLAALLDLLRLTASGRQMYAVSPYIISIEIENENRRQYANPHFMKGEIETKILNPVHKKRTRTNTHGSLTLKQVSAYMPILYTDIWHPLPAVDVTASFPRMSGWNIFVSCL